MSADADPSFEVATIKPSDPAVRGSWVQVDGRTLSTHNISLAGLIKFTYGVHLKLILSGPDWMDKETYDISAVADLEGQPSDKQWKNMLKKLLADRFKLTFHPEKREAAVYAITVGKDRSRNMAENTSGGLLPTLSFHGIPGGIVLRAKNATVSDIASQLQNAFLDRPVVDRTELKGRYDFNLKWAPDDPRFAERPLPPSNAADAPPGLFTAIQEQIGLKIETTKAQVDSIVVDHVEKPSAN